MPPVRRTYDEAAEPDTVLDDQNEQLRKELMFADKEAERDTKSPLRHV